jgi:hypothetical protein
VDLCKVDLCKVDLCKVDLAGAKRLAGYRAAFRAARERWNASVAAGTIEANMT